MNRPTQQQPSKAKRRSQRQTQGPNPAMAEAMRQALQKQAQGRDSPTGGIILWETITLDRA